MNNIFSEVKKNFGFGCMRLPMTKEDEIDYDQVSKMVDYFLDNGFNYFDTAYPYLQKRSEGAIKKCLTSRYSRDKYILADKLTFDFFNNKEELLNLFNTQLGNCGVDYFDFYLMHCQNKKRFEKGKSLDVYNICYDLKKQGKIKHLGFSFHDKADVLEEMLSTYDFFEFVQLQFNYLDYDSDIIESKKCYDVCVKHKIPVIVMEPIKGGYLANLPKVASKYLNELNGGSQASYALRYCGSFDNIFMILSGMSSIEQMEDNVSFMKDFKPLDKNELEAIENTRKILKNEKIIACTNCRYCCQGCPKHIPIPDIFNALNASYLTNDWNDDMYGNILMNSASGKPSECIKCGKCEDSCPQHLHIRDLLVEAKEKFENYIDD